LQKTNNNNQRHRQSNGNIANLSKAKQKRINSAITAAKNETDIQYTAQSSIPYLAMYKDGVCQVTAKKYSKTIEFYDVSYMLASKDEQTAVFEGLCDFYNYFDPSIQIQQTFISRRAAKDEFQKSIQIPLAHDGFDHIREEYSGILKTHLEKGNNGLVRSKYLTYSVEAETLKNARSRLGRIEIDIVNLFKQMGVASRPLNGKERLAVMHGVLHLGTTDKFIFDWNSLHKSGLSTKDHVAPSSFNFGDGRTFGIGGQIGAISFLQIIAPELNDRILADFLEVDSNVVVNVHIRSIDQAKALKMVKRKITDIDGMKINEQKKAVRQGYDMDLLPSDLNTYGDEAKKLLRDLQSRNERMFLITITTMNVANSKQALDNRVFQMSGIAQKHNCALVRLDYMQEQGLMSCLPLGENQVPIQRALTTSGAAIFIPFITRELFQGKGALYYGRNAVSGNMIMCDRKLLKNPNGLILGVPGCGKSFSAKREVTNAWLTTDDDSIILDPEDEYSDITRALSGQVIKLSATGSGQQYVNPMDINLNYADDDENPIALKSDFILSFCEVIAGNKNGLEAIEKTVIDRAVQNVYAEVLAEATKNGGNIPPEKMPILEDLYKELCKMPEPEAKRIAAALDLYVHGSLNIFNHRTNVDINNRLVCFNIKELGKQLKTLGMLVVQDQIWNRVTKNRAKNKSTRYYVDEFHLLLQGEIGAWSVEIWKRFRKWGGIPTGITQNVKNLLASKDIEDIFENSDFIYMLSQAPGDREILAEKLNISPKQIAYVTQSQPGEGLVIYGGITLPFIDRFPKDTNLYRLMSTKFGEKPA